MENSHGLMVDVIEETGKMENSTVKEFMSQQMEGKKKENGKKERESDG